MSRGIADGVDEVDDVEVDGDEVSNRDLAEMIFILFNEVKVLQLRLDEVLNAKD